MTKLKFKSGVFKSFNKYISVIIFFITFFYIVLYIYIYIYIYKCLNIYPLNIIKKIKKARERYQNLSKEEKESNNMVANVTKISQKLKKMNWLGIEANIIE